MSKCLFCTNNNSGFSCAKKVPGYPNVFHCHNYKGDLPVAVKVAPKITYDDPYYLVQYTDKSKQVVRFIISLP